MENSNGHYLPEDNETRKVVSRKFAQNQTNYVQSKNPLGIDSVVVQFTTVLLLVYLVLDNCEPLENIHILYGALTGGPDENV